MIRIALYSLTTAVALIGLYYGLAMAGPHALDRLDRNWALDADGSETFFRGVVVLFLSIITLILVHLAHRLARVFEAPVQPPVTAGPVSDLSGTPWEKKSPSTRA